MKERTDRGQNKANPDRRANRTILLRTVILLALFGIGAFLPLFGRLYAIQIRDHEMYEEKAINQQTMDNAVAADRGTIYDANGRVLAMSATVYDIIISPKDFATVQKNWDKKYADDPANAPYPRPEAETVAEGLAKILGADEEKILTSLTKESYYEVVARRVEDEVADQVRQFILDNRLSNSLYPSPTTKRYYPYGSLASQVIGWVNPNTDNTGAYGMEALYEKELAGETGRVVTAKKGDGTEMKYSFQNYYDATDGYNLNLTLDTTIQYYCERVLEKGIEMFEVQDGGFAIAMDPKTGAIKAWANSPTYDLNSPWSITDPILSQYLETVQNDPAAAEGAYNTALGQMQNQQWRNKAINDTYEPGSTFKSIVLAAALEEGVVNEADHFNCVGYATVADRQIGCSKKTGHGDQSLAQAVANSCNPAFIAIGQRLGAEKFYNYMEDFGFLEPTGVDMQGESQIDPVDAGLIWSRDKFTSANGITNLATASFGQRFQITPIQLVSAISAVINGGHLMEPYVMSSVTDTDGNIIDQNEATEVRQVISQETSDRCRAILEKVVDGGSGKRAYVPGYRIGGKTGSSETLEEDHTIVSFIGFAPVDDPQIVVLLAFDNPKPVEAGSTYTSKGYYISGGNMSAVLAGDLIADILDYMGVEKDYTGAEDAMVDTTVPDLVGQSLEIGQETAEDAGFTVRLVGEGDTVTDQLPMGGAVIPSGSEVVLYLGAEKESGQVQVPSVWGESARSAQQILARYGLYLKVTGSSSYMSEQARVANQSIQPGTRVERGTVVECMFVDNSAVD